MLRLQLPENTPQSLIVLCDEYFLFFIVDNKSKTDSVDSDSCSEAFEIMLACAISRNYELKKKELEERDELEIAQALSASLEFDNNYPVAEESKQINNAMAAKISQTTDALSGCSSAEFSFRLLEDDNDDDDDLLVENKIKKEEEQLKYRSNGNLSILESLESTSTAKNLNKEIDSHKKINYSPEEKKAIVNHLTTVVEQELLSLLKDKNSKTIHSEMSSDISISSQTERPIPKARTKVEYTDLSELQSVNDDSELFDFDFSSGNLVLNKTADIQGNKLRNDREGSVVSRIVNKFENIKIAANKSDPGIEKFPKNSLVVLREAQPKSEIIKTDTKHEAQSSSKEETTKNVALKNPFVLKNVEEFECIICTETHSILNGKSFGCSHLFCKECLTEYLSNLIQEGNLDSLICPQPKCDSIASEFLIKQLLPNSVIDRYSKLQLKRGVENMEDIFYCPQCNDPVECDISVTLGECYKCSYCFCTSCLKSFHGFTDCDLNEEERQQLLRNYIKQQNNERQIKVKKKALAKQKLRDIEERKQMRLREEYLTNSFINTSLKKCPGCQTSIENDGIGCNHMTCLKCKTEFCWLCLIKLDTKKDQELHFAKCTLFEHSFIED